MDSEAAIITVVRDADEVLVLRVHVDLRMENAGRFMGEATPLVKTMHRRVVVDLSPLRFMDSSGVGAMLKFQDIVQERQASLFLYGLNQSMDSVFRLSGLTKIFHILSEEEAESQFPELFL